MRRQPTWPVRRFDREISLALETLSGPKGSQRWWATGNDKGGGAGFSADAVLEDSVATHLPLIGPSATNFVLLRALLRPARGVVALTSAAYARLLARFPELSRECAAALLELETCGLESAQAIAAAVSAVVAVLAVCLGPASLVTGRAGSPLPATGGDADIGFSAHSVALLFLFRGGGPSASAAAAALRSAGAQLAQGVATALACEALSAAIALCEDNATLPKQGESALFGYALCVAALTSSVKETARNDTAALSPLTVRLRNALALLQNADVERTNDWISNWTQALAALEDAIATQGSLSPQVALAGQALPTPHWQLCEVDRDALSRPPLHQDDSSLEGSAFPLPLGLWPAIVPEVGHDGAVASSLAATPASDAESLHINLYADPAARAAQDAMVAALPPARRTETLLSVAKAGDGEEYAARVGQLLEAWIEDPGGCAAVVLRHDSDDSSAWPTAVLVPLLVELVRRDAPGWRGELASGFPPDRTLFDALWAHLCSTHSATATTVEGFWPWALGALCVSLVSSGTTRSLRVVTFGIHVAYKIGVTLRADVTARRASAELDLALGIGKLAIVTCDNALSAAKARLAGFSQAPIAAVLLSLAEVVSGGRPADVLSFTTFESADETLECWARLSLCVLADTLHDPGGSNMLAAQLARVHSGSVALSRYARLLVKVLLSDGLVNRRGGASVQGETWNSEAEELLLLCACCALDPTTRPEDREAGVPTIRDQLHSIAVRGDLDPLTALTRALGTWPSRRLATLVLHVLPVVFDDCSAIRTPIGPTPGRRLDCSCPPLVSYSLCSPVLKTLHCFLCCAVARTYARPPEAVEVLRSATDVLRCSATALGTASCSGLARRHIACELFVAFLHAFFGVAPRLAASRPASPTVIAAVLLLRSFSGHEASNAFAPSSGAIAERMQQLEALVVC